MKKLVIFILFVFMAIAVSSCMVGLDRDGYNNHDGTYRNNDNGRHERSYNRNRNRDNRNVQVHDDDPVLIIR